MDVPLLIAALTGDPSPLRARFAEMAVTHALGSSLAKLCPEHDAVQLIEAYLTRETLETLQNTWLTAIVDRCREAVGESGEDSGAWVPDEVAQRLSALFNNPRGPRFHYVQDLVDPQLMRQLLTPVFQEVLLSFATRLPQALGLGGRPGAGGAPDLGNLLGRLGKDIGGHGKRLVDVGRSVVGGLGLEDKLQQGARDFSQQAVTAFRDGLARRVESDEGQRLLAALAERGVHAALKIPLSDLNADLSRIPLADVLALVPAELSYIAERPLFSELLRSEVASFYREWGEQPVGSLLEHLGTRTATEKVLQQGAEEHLKGLFASAAFEAWLKDLLTQG